MEQPSADQTAEDGAWHDAEPGNKHVISTYAAGGFAL